MAGLADKLAQRGTSLGAEPPAPAPPAPAAARYLEIDPRRIKPNPEQPRQEFDPAELERLAESIREHGVIQPLAVRLEAGEVILIDGERRLRASILAGRPLVPCLAQGGDGAVLALVANLHRQDLTPLEEAEAYGRLQSERGYTLEQLAAIAGKAKSTVSEILSLNKLAAVRKIVAANPEKFPQRVLVELAKQAPGHIEVMAANVAAGQMKTEDLRAMRRLPAPKPPARPKPPREGDSELARADALFRRAEQLAGELLGVNLHGLNYRQRVLARHSLQPLARALDRLFHHLKGQANSDAQRWSPERRARLLDLTRKNGMTFARMALGKDINDDGQPLHPSELAHQLTLAREEHLAATDNPK